MMIEKIEINLLPAEYRVHKRKIKLSRAVVYPVLGLLVLGVSAALFSIYLQNKVDVYEGEIENLNREIKRNSHIQTEINKLRQDKNIIDEKILALERININREKWVRLLEVMSNSLPSYSWLISVKEELGPPSVLKMEGRTYSFPEVAHYMTKLKNNDYISDVELSDIEQVSGQGRRVYRFTISCTVNPDVNLDVPSQEGSNDG
ncbi:MAG: PilN domain-containing protein [Chitinispirillaceae bacterium]